MTPDKFISQWKANCLTERSGAIAHFEDLCTLLDVEKPREYGEYCYEQGLKKLHGGIGFADVWKRRCFAWENKGPTKNLEPALLQLKQYADALDNPPVLVVCNRDRIEIHPRFNDYPSTPTIIQLEDVGKAENLQKLRWLFSPDDVKNLRPLKSNAAITRDTAIEFAVLAESMRKRDLDAHQVAHFLIQCIFCMYAEDEGLLHVGVSDDPSIFTGILRSAKDSPDKAKSRMAALFRAMQVKGSQYGNDDIAWFNGGLFKAIDIPPLTADDLTILRRAAEELDWRAIDPTIFGTLFERGLDPKARAPLGAHYTDVETIKKLIDPVITLPLKAEWELAKETLIAAQKKPKKSESYKKAIDTYHAYLERLRNFRVLDPACGSGNFLYLALHALKDLEHKAQIDAELLGYGRQISVETGPQNIMGIEINEYAAELARATVWIGDIQWCRRNGRPIAQNPILRSLDSIENRDALINVDGTEVDWPKCDSIVGNPPFLGGSVMRGELGDAYTDTLRRCFEGRVPGGADLVTYWFEKSRAHIEAGRCHAAGLVATNSIRGGANRKVLERILETTQIFNAWSDLEWVNDGAAVRVSLISFGNRADRHLDGKAVEEIFADLSASTGVNLILAKRLPENKQTCFEGVQKNGPFDIPGELARSWLVLPNPNSLPNSLVVKPYCNAKDVASRATDYWMIDFTGYEELASSLFEKPFNYVVTFVKPDREKKREEYLSRKYWLLKRSAPDFRRATNGLSRYLITPRHAKYRLFVWQNGNALPDSAVNAIARSDDTTFGILHSRFHELWSLRLGTSLEDRPRYTPTTTFETFPFPPGLTPCDTANLQKKPNNATTSNKELNPAIAGAAKILNDHREAWLNPPAWVDWVITPEEKAAGFPARPVAKPGKEAELKKRTLTNLYNNPPTWLTFAHQALDKAVANAYGWKDYKPETPDEEILRRLLALNQQRALVAKQPTESEESVENEPSTDVGEEAVETIIRRSKKRSVKSQ